MAKLVKPGGKLCLYENMGSESIFYAVGSEKFYSLSFPPKVLTDILAKLGFQDIQVTEQPHDDDPAIKQDKCDSKGLMFVVATKN